MNLQGQVEVKFLKPTIKNLFQKGVIPLRFCSAFAVCGTNKNFREIAEKNGSCQFSDGYTKISSKLHFSTQ